MHVSLQRNFPRLPEPLYPQEKRADGTLSICPLGLSQGLAGTGAWNPKSFAQKQDNYSLEE